MDLVSAFGTCKPVIGMLHVPPLPGSPCAIQSFSDIKDWVIRDADALTTGGVHGFILENFGDVPFYPRRVPAHTVAFLVILAHEVRSRFRLPLGVNVLRNDGESAIAVAAATGAEFVRVNVYTGARVTDQGIIQGKAHRLQRYRRLLANSVQVFADVAVKHSAPLGYRELTDEVEDTVERGCADAIIVSGNGTGKETRIEDVKLAKTAARATPVFIGSGLNATSLPHALSTADGLIVGTAFKKDGFIRNPVDVMRVRELMAAVTGK